MAQFGVPQIYGSGVPIMRALRDHPTPETDYQLRARAAEEERELALLAQFMRHNSVASLAKAMAARSGGSMRARDLIAAAGLNSSDG